MDITISKTYSESIVIDYQTWKYSTTISKSVSVSSAEELEAENDKLQKQVKMLTQRDIDREQKHRFDRLNKIRENEDV